MQVWVPRGWPCFCYIKRSNSRGVSVCASLGSEGFGSKGEIRGCAVCSHNTCLFTCIKLWVMRVVGQRACLLGKCKGGKDQTTATKRLECKRSKMEGGVVSKGFCVWVNSSSGWLSKQEHQSLCWVLSGCFPVWWWEQVRKVILRACLWVCCWECNPRVSLTTRTASKLCWLVWITACRGNMYVCFSYTCYYRWPVITGDTGLNQSCAGLQSD